MTASATDEQRVPAGAAGPEILYSGEPSRISRLFAILLRVTLRPWIAFSAALSAFVIRRGPSGIEMWRIWSPIVSFADWIGVISPAPRGTTIERVRLPDCRAELVRARDVAPGGRVVLYFHGGGYVACGLRSHRRMVARLSAAADATVLNVAYRMLPRSELRHAIADGVAGYRQLLDNGIAPERIVFAGDSAGGGLSFLVAAVTRDHGLPMPAGIVGISPWCDLDCTEKLEHPNARTDPLVPIKAAAFVVEQLICKGGDLDPLLSPINLDLAGLPPVLLHVGTTEVLELDAVNLSERLAAAGVPVTLKHWRGQVHDFQLLGTDLLPEAREAIGEIGVFVSRVAA